MCDYDIRLRRLDEIEDRSREAFEDACDEIREEMEIEYEQEFGPEYRAVHPFKPDHAKIHALALKKLSEVEHG